MSEPFSQDDAQSCIVIHPGSRYLKIGRPSDLAPRTILNAIAYRRRGEYSHCDTFLPPFASLESQEVQEIEECRLKASHLMQMSLMSDGSRRFATPCQQISVFNKRCKAEVDNSNPISSNWDDPDCDVIVGDKILSIRPGSLYNIIFPYIRGELNVHSGVGGSLTAVLSHLEIIWKYAISTILDVPTNDLKFYRAVLIIPDIYNRDYIKKLTNLLLVSLGFGSCFVVQDHVAATFGAGLGTACVIDIGDQKTSVSCVEDAISHPATRVRMCYGGADITQLFHWLMKKSSFPYKFDIDNQTDVALLTRLKQEFCHLNLDLCGASEKDVCVLNPGERPKTYKVQMGDEVVIAPLSLFFPDLLRITGIKYNFFQKPNPGDSEDHLDEMYLRETSRMKGREAIESMDMDKTEGGDPADEEMPLEDNNLVTKQIDVAEKLFSLEEAILSSIDRCPSDEMKRKMYSCILVVGAGGKFENIGKWIQDRISLQIPLAFRPESIEVITRPKDMDPAITAWKGGALFTCLDGSSELWISQQEWQKYGVRILREKCPFLW